MMHEEWMMRAVDAYRGQAGEGTEKYGLQKVCNKMVKRCWEEDKGVIRLDKETLRRRMNGVQSKAKSNTAKGWLSEVEEDMIVNYAIELANRGLPLRRKRLHEHAEALCRAWHGPAFTSLGKHWAKHFVARHKKKLKPFWSRSLDRSRARAGNPHTKKAFFEIFEAVVQGKEGEEFIAAELIYGVDESRFQSGIGVREWVYGPAGKKLQTKQRSGGRENTTAIVTICADGTSLPPGIIFKGEGFQVSWRQNNPLNTS